METVTIEPFFPDSEDWAVLANLVDCYREVFAEPPWNEWLACAVSDCKASWGKTQAAELAQVGFVHCGLPVVDYWPHAEVIKNFLDELDQGAVCWLAVERAAQGGEQVVGFTWGSPIVARWQTFVPELQESLRREFGEDVANNRTIVYQTEVGVRATHRNRGLARRLTERRNQDFLARGFLVGITGVRETPQPSVTFLWYTKLGYRVVHRFPPDNGRVVLARELEPGLFDHP